MYHKNMDSSTRKPVLANMFIVLFLAAIAAVFMFLPVKAYSLFFLFLIFFIAAFFLLNNKLGFLLILFIRPILDIWTNLDVLKIGDYSLNVSALLAVIVVILAISAYMRQSANIRNLPTKIAWMLFILVTFVSAAVSFNHAASLAEWIRILSIFAIFLISFIVILENKDHGEILCAVAYSALIPSFVAAYQFVTDSGMTIPMEGIANRIFGTFAHPNLLAYYLVFLIVIVWYLIIIKKGNLVVNSLVLAFYIILLILTYTRGAWLALLLTFSLIGLIRYRRLLLFLLFSIIFIYLAVEPIRDRVDAIWQYNPDSSISWRQDIWNDGLNIARNKPYLGYGTGTSQKLLLEARGLEAGSSDPHNDYLKLFLENGLTGVFAYIALISALLFNLAKNYWKSQNPEQKDLYLILLSFSAAFFIMSFADNVLRNTALQWSFWAVMGGALALKPGTEEVKN